jgi:cysteine desulfuration protein SufE
LSTVAERVSAVLAEITPLDREMRVAVLVDWAARFREVPPEVASRPFPADHRVPWCQSDAYVWAVTDRSGAIAFHFGIDNPQGVSAMALAAILTEVTAGVRPGEVGALRDDLAYELFGTELSMGKGQGLAAMVAMVKVLARALPAVGATPAVGGVTP